MCPAFTFQRLALKDSSFDIIIYWKYKNKLLALVEKQNVGQIFKNMEVFLPYVKIRQILWAEVEGAEITLSSHGQHTSGLQT